MKITLLLLITLVSSCSLQNRSNGIDTISIGDSSDRDLSINPDQSDSYGPISDGEELSATPESKKIVHSLTVYSTLYASLGLVPLFKEAEKRRIPFSIITANGFASLISVLYAKKKSSNYLEWKLFDLLKRLDGKTPFTKNWTSEIERFLKAEFGTMQLQQLKVLVLIPVNVAGDVKLSATGSIVSKVMQSLALQNNTSFYQSPTDFRSQLDSIGMDMNLAVSFLSRKVNFKHLSGFEWGLYTTYLSYLEANSDLFQSVSSSSDPILDDAPALSDISTSYSKSIDDILKRYELKIEEWKNHNSTSSEPEI